MKPLICFYQNEKYIYSSNYQLIECPPLETVSDFLKRIELQFFDTFKVVQVNFEFDNIRLFENQKALYPIAKANVFLLTDYNFLTQNDFNSLTVVEKLKLNFNLLESKSSFIEKVNTIRNEIARGRIYQVNLTSALATKTTTDAHSLFNYFSTLFTGRYKALLPLTNVDIISFSPELFLQKNKNELVTQPIKGSVSQELDFNVGLIDNRKEEAELSMIVDLLRNDLNRTEPNNSATVTAHRALMKLGYIQHTYSEIKIVTDKNLAEILPLVSPGGSISGCPKVESLKLISEIETIKRQAYTGTLGWWHKNEFCLNLTIRTFIKNHDDLYYHAGCGIVYDSKALNEWNEFILKTGALNLNPILN